MRVNPSQLSVPCNTNCAFQISKILSVLITVALTIILPPAPRAYAEGSVPTSNCNNLAANIIDANSFSPTTFNNNILNSDFEYGVTEYVAGQYPWNFRNPFEDSKFEWMTTDEQKSLEIWHVEKYYDEEASRFFQILEVPTI